MSALDQTFAALADPTRRGVIELLRQRPWRAGELAAQFGASAPAMSRHLKVLRLRGLVEEDRGERADSRLRFYRLRRQRFAELRTWLDRVEGFWTDQLGAFKTHVAGKRKR